MFSEDVVLSALKAGPCWFIGQNGFSHSALDADNSYRNRKAVISKIAFKANRGIVHVQIEKQGHLAFVACDQFHEDCVWVSSDVSASLLAELVEKRVLFSYKPA